ncbi:M28 family peptidase [Kitasatospora sp. NPDC048407]|uniref:M28 family peptidase n=1 Tax=Kitasatospora sp. NPDC048407 TaxID=3364051 RepID=UPI00371B573C
MTVKRSDLTPVEPVTPTGAPPGPPRRGSPAPATRWAFPVTVLVLAALCAALTAWQDRLPAPRDENAPALSFSAARAVDQVRAIATEPRPSGSPAHTQVRADLVRKLTELGLETRVQTGSSVAHMPDLSPTGADSRYAGLRVDNVVARLPGSANTRPVALVTHYDSTEAGPGANDAGVPVAVLLETARALRAGPAPRNDVLFVFTDAEESGLLGSRALVDAPDFLPPDALVLNFEARGSRGPSLMFETGPDAAWLVDALAGHVPSARTSSLLDAAYGYLPNLTDFTVFKQAGHQGLNLAYLDGYTAYHSADDTPDRVDPATVQHQGEQALGLARALGSADLAHPPRGDSVYFQAAGLYLAYPAGAALPAALATAALGLFLLLRLRARAGLSLARTAAGLALALGQMLLAAGAAFALAPLVASRHAEFGAYGDIADHGLALAGFLLLTLALGAAAALLARRRIDARHQAAGAIALWVLLACASAVVLPGGSHVFTWPALGLVAAAALLTSRAGATVAGRVAGAALAVLPLGLLVVPLVPLLTDALGLGLVAVPVAVAALMTALLPPVLPPLPRRTRPLVPAAAALVAAAVLAAGALIPPPQPYRERANALYLLDADRGTATWLSDSPPDAWSDRLLPDPDPVSVADLWPGWRVPVRRAGAPVLPLAAPEITVTPVPGGPGDGRRVSVRAVSKRGAPELVLLVTGAAVRGYALDGVPGWHADTPAGNPPWELWIHRVPAEGAGLLLDLGPGPATLKVIDRTPGLPAPDGTPLAGPRPPALGVAAFGEAAMVSVTRSLD